MRRNEYRHFPEESIQEAKRHREKGSSSLIFREKQVETTMSYSSAPVKGHSGSSGEMTSADDRTLNAQNVLSHGAISSAMAVGESGREGDRMS